MAKKVSTWSAETPLEKEFQELCETVSPRLQELWAAVKEMSDEYGIPVGPYIPESFKDRFITWDSSKRLDPEFVIGLTGSTADEEEFWYSSSRNC